MPATDDQDDTLLVGLVPTKVDLQRVVEERWYRIPVRSAPKRNWPPRWFAALASVEASGEGAQVIRYFAPVLDIEDATREQLFPGVPPGDRAGKLYHLLKLGPVQERAPIYLQRPRRHPFIPTRFEKFRRAVTVNDLFDESPVEDELWEVLKAENIAAERQWPQTVEHRRFYIDFAVFCNRGGLAVEVDGQHHYTPPKAIADDERDTLLATRGWQMHHIPTLQIRRALSHELDKLRSVINTKGGLLADGLVPRLFIPGSNAVQYSFFEPRAPYDTSLEADDDIEDWD